MINLEGVFTRDKLQEFAETLQSLSEQVGFKVSSRGWCYIMENARYINKDQFDRVDSMINKCRKIGLLPVDFVAEEDARAFAGVEEKSHGTVKGVLRRMLTDVMEGYEYYTPDWWEGEQYYIPDACRKDRSQDSIRASLPELPHTCCK